MKQLLHQVDIESSGITLIVEKTVGPKVPGIFIDERVIFGVWSRCKGSCRLFLLLYRHLLS